MIKWLKHAFAVDPPGPAEPTPAQRDAVEKVCREVVRRHLTTVSLMFLKMNAPLNWVSAQVLHFFMPIITVLAGDGPKHFAEFLEHRGSIDYICRRIEDLEAEATERERTNDECRNSNDEANPNDEARTKND